MDIRNTDPLLKDTLDLVENIEFSDVKPKLEIKQEEQFKIENQEFWKSPAFDVKPKLEPVEASENACNSSFIEKGTLNNQSSTIRNSDLLIEFAENIEFSDNNELKTEIKEEEFKNENHQQFWKSTIFDVKPKLEQIESSETAQAKIKTEPEKFFNSDPEEETLSNESLEIKDEFMWAMKDFVSDNVPRKHIEQQIAEKKKAFECSLNPSKFAQKYQLTKHIVALHENKKPFECSLCPSKFDLKYENGEDVTNTGDLFLLCHKKIKIFCICAFHFCPFHWISG